MTCGNGLKERWGRVLGIAGLLALFAAGSPAQEGTETIIETPRPPNRRGKARPPTKNVCWLPKGCTYVRGIVVGNGMIKALAVEERFRKMAAEENLGTVLCGGGWKTLDEILDKWAEASGHAEIRGAPVFISGLSASVLGARVMVYERPERCFGILHVAGGNLHQKHPEGKTLSGVPFMAVNGEYESCGPEGGIRPHLGLDTQWYLMGEQMLERRRQDPNHLMCMVVVPIKGHTAWSKHLAELFIRKCAKYRIPKEKRDGSKPAKCLEIKAESGWLSHRNIKHPPIPPAAWAGYEGEKSEAFWHLDEEMAKAVRQYHTDGIRPGQERTLFRPAGLFEELWPLGERMGIPFKGHTPKEHAGVLRKWIDAKTDGRLGDIPAAALAKSIAAGLKPDEEDPSSSPSPGDRDSAAAGDTVDESVCRYRCLRVCHAYDDAFRPVEKAIDAAALPGESRDLLRAHYAEQLLVRRPNGELPELPVRGILARIGGIPDNSGPAKIEAWLKDKTPPARDVLNKLYGVAAGPRPDVLDGLLEELQKKPSKRWYADGSLVGPSVDKLAELGAAAIPDLARMLEYADQPADFRAAMALGRMGKLAAPALPELRKAASRGGISELEGLQSPKALAAIEAIESDL